MSTTEVLAEIYYTPAEAAKKLRLTVRTVWKRIREGKVKATKGHRRLIPSSELTRLLQVELESSTTTASK